MPPISDAIIPAMDRLELRYPSSLLYVFSDANYAIDCPLDGLFAEDPQSTISYLSNNIYKSIVPYIVSIQPFTGSHFTSPVSDLNIQVVDSGFFYQAVNAIMSLTPKDLKRNNFRFTAQDRRALSQACSDFNDVLHSA